MVDSKAFATRVLPKYFERSSFGPFVKELMRWGFVRREADSGIEDAFSNKYFRRDSPDLITLMRCRGRPSAKSASDAIKTKKNAQKAGDQHAATKTGQASQGQTSRHQTDSESYKHRQQGKSAVRCDDRMQNGSERGGSSVLPNYYQHLLDRPAALNHPPPVHGHGNQWPSHEPRNNPDSTRMNGRSSLSGASQSSGFRDGSANDTDQAFAWRIIAGEGFVSSVPKGGLSNSQHGTGRQQQRSSFPGFPMSEQTLPIHAQMNPERLNALLALNSYQNPSGLDPLKNSAQSVQALQNQQNLSQFSTSNAQSLASLANSQQESSNNVAPATSELSADINAAIEKEVARRLDSIMSIAANMEIMKEQAKTTARFRMAAAAALQQEQNSSSAASLEEYRKRNNMMGPQNP